MSLFNSEYIQLKEERDQYLEQVLDNKVRQYQYVLGKFIFEDNYSAIFKDVVEIEEIQKTLNPDTWSIPMQHFSDCLKCYIDHKTLSLNQLQAALVKIPTENIEERLTAGLEFFKAIIVNKDAIKYSSLALSFLNSTVEFFLISNPSSEAISFYIDKINFINELITNLGIGKNPKVKELVTVLNQIVYRFINRQDEDRLRFTTPINIEENVVASIAPIIGNAPTKFNTDPKKLVFDPEFLINKGFVSNDLACDYADFMAEANYHLVFTEDVQSALNKAKFGVEKAKTQAARIGKNVSTVGGRAVATGKVMGKRALNQVNSGFEKFKNALFKQERKTEEALRNASFLDQKLTSLFAAAMATGASYIAFGGLGGILTAIALKYSYDKTISKERSRLKARLKEEIVIVDEKIKDYESSGDKEVKYALMRIKIKMIKAVEALDTRRAVADVGDEDLKGFTVDEKRLVRKGRIERARQERYARSYDDDNDNRYDN